MSIAAELIIEINQPLTSDASADWSWLQELEMSIATLDAPVYLKRAVYQAWYKQLRKTADRFEVTYEPHTGIRGGRLWFANWEWKGKHVKSNRARSKKAALRGLVFCLRYGF